jgi:calcium-dependent protein kinase
METKLGTPLYVSPEVLEGKYDKRCDLWSLGVMTYMILSGKPPFDGRNEVEVFNKIRCCNYDFPESDWRHISEDAQDFISGLLKNNPDRRLSISEAFSHPWL